MDDKVFEESKKKMKNDINQKGFYLVDRKILNINKDETDEFLKRLNKDLEGEYEKKELVEDNASADFFFVYDKKRCKPVEVTGVAGFLREVFGNKSDTLNRYFRGQKACNNLYPSLFRGNGERVKREVEYNARVYNDRPKDFADCNSTFDKLVRLKHYKQPSRLLDLTASPLVALFFACHDFKKEGKDDPSNTGVVLEVYCKKEDEKISVSSDTVALLTAMTNTKIKNDGVSKIPCCDPGKNGEDPLCIIPKKNKDKSCYDKCWPRKETDKDRDEELKKNLSERWACDYLGELGHQCMKENGMPVKWGDICYSELNQSILVKPPLNNDRIVRQQGCFIMCGMNPKNIYKPPKDLYDFFRRTDNGVANFYYVLPKNKVDILKELKVLGMDEYYFFPELEREIKVVSGIEENPEQG